MGALVIPCTLNAEIVEDTPTTPGSTSNGIRVDWAGTSQAFRGLFRFPITTVGPGFTAAFVRLRQVFLATADGIFIAKRVETNEWDALATWETIDGTIAWSTQGGDFVDGSSFSSVPKQGRSDAGLIDIDCRGILTDALALPMTTLEVLLKLETEGLGALAGCPFDSIESGVTPVLVVEYPGESRRPFGNRPYNARPWARRPWCKR